MQFRHSWAMTQQKYKTIILKQSVFLIQHSIPTSHTTDMAYTRGKHNGKVNAEQNRLTTNPQITHCGQPRSLITLPHLSHVNNNVTQEKRHSVMHKIA